MEWSLEDFHDHLPKKSHTKGHPKTTNNYQQGMPQVASGYHMMTDVPALDAHIDPRLKLKIWQGV